MCLAYYLQCYCYHIANVIILFEIKLFEIILFEIKVFDFFEDLDNFAVDIRSKKRACSKFLNTLDFLNKTNIYHSTINNFIVVFLDISKIIHNFAVLF